MKKIYIFCLFAHSLLHLYGQQANDELIFKAMHDEMQRNATQLELPEKPRPFFLSYTYGHYRNFEVTGVLGSVVRSFASPETSAGAVQLLLGNYSHTSDGSYSNPLIHQKMPSTADYDAIRRNYWLASDKMYKYALQLEMQKESVRKASPLSSEEKDLPDLERVASVRKIVERNGKFDINQTELEKIACELSALFKEYKKIENSVVMISGFSSDIYKQTSEDVVLKQPNSLVSLVVQGNVMTDDGTIIQDVFSLQVDTPASLPSIDELKKEVRAFADNLMSLREAQPIDEYYSGPVLLEDGACSSMFISNLLYKGGLLAFRKPIGNNASYGLGERLGDKIIDSRITVTNCTDMKEYKGMPLWGAYEIDAEGVVPKAQTVLIEKGMLKGLLNGCIPSPYAPHSTGSSRFLLAPANYAYTTAPGVVHIQADKTTKQGKMKKALLKAARKEGLKHAYIVRKVAENASLVYQTDVETGREILVRNVSISPIGLDKMEDMAEISSEEHAFNYVWNGQVFSSFIGPRSVLLKNIKITKGNSQAEKKPVLTFPLER